MKGMRFAKASLAVVLCGTMTVPASAQAVAARAASESAAARVVAFVPTAAASLSVGPSAAFAPGAAFPSAPALAAPSAVPFAAPSALLAAAPLSAAPAAAPVLRPSARPAVAPLAAPAPESVRASAAASVGANDRPFASGESSVASERAASESFWSGAAKRADSDDAVPAAPAAGRWAAAGAILTPAAHEAHLLSAHMVPYAEAGAALVGAYAVNRVARVVLAKFAAKKNMDRHQVAAIRLVVSVVVWTAATAGALMLGGASHETLTTVFGAGGTILTLALKDVLGNLIQGVNFLITKPFAIGSRVSIDDQVGTVADATLTSVDIKKDDGSDIKIRHAALAAKPVVVFGAYSPESAPLKLSLKMKVPLRPKFQGAVGAVWRSLDKRFWLAGVAFAALTVVPGFVPALAGGWVATVIHYALAGSLAWFTRRLDLALTAAVDKLADANGWRQETRVITKLAVRVGLWALGGGAFLRMIGVTWTALAASLGLTTLGIGLASNNFFGSVVQGGEVLFSKPFKVGDRVKVGAFEGVVEDMTLYHTVIKLDEGRHVLVPYAVVRDATLVVTQGK